jgi:hypothetical protein
MNSSVLISNSIPIPTRSNSNSEFNIKKKNNSLIFTSGIVESFSSESLMETKYANESNVPNQPITATPPEPHMINRFMIMSKCQK